MGYAGGHSLEGDGAEEEDDEDDVGVDGRDVDDLRVLSDPLDYADVDQAPEWEYEFSNKSSYTIIQGGPSEG